MLFPERREGGATLRTAEGGGEGSPGRAGGGGRGSYTPGMQIYSANPIVYASFSVQSIGLYSAGCRYSADNAGTTSATGTTSNAATIGYFHPCEAISQAL